MTTSTTITGEVAATLAELRREVSALHAELPRNELVVWTAGNVSARVPGRDLLVIKPSGVSYDELSPGDDGGHRLRRQPRRGRARPVVGHRRARLRLRAHAEVGGVVHTHSTYATAWAARGEPIPCVLTMMADEFGGEIPIGPFALDRRRLDRPRHRRDPARPPLAGGADAEPRRRSPSAPTARAAVKAAVMCEEVARTVHIARQLGEPAAHRRSPTSTRCTTATRTPTASARRTDAAMNRMTHAAASPHRAGSSPAARACTARRRRPGGAAVAARSSRQLDAADELAGAGGVEAGADRLRRHPPGHAGRQRRPGLHRRDRLDAHVLAGQDVDRRARRAADAAAAPAHPGERLAALGRDRHGLHEPQPGRPRRPGVRLHPDPARGAPQDRRRPRQSDPAVAAPGRGAGSGLRAASPRCAALQAGPVRRQHARRRRHRGRQGRGRAAVRRLGEHVRRQRPGRRSSTRSPTPRSTTLVERVRRPLRDRARAARRRRPARVAALRRPDRGRPARVPRPTAASAPSPRTSRTSAGCASCRAWPCSG